MNIFGTILEKIFHPGQAAANQNASQAGSTPSTSSNVDVNSILAGMAAKENPNLNWRSSIVDLMKLLHLDSSLEARKELAKELGFTGDTNDSAAMNIWLSKQVMQKLAENGGKVPDALKH